MRGTIQNKVDRETHFTNEFDQFVAEPGEALVSVYNRFAQLMNDLERNDMHFPIQFKKLVNVSRAKKLEKSHDPLALVAHTGLSSRNTSSYYVTHPTYVVDYEDEYQIRMLQHEIGNDQSTLDLCPSETLQLFNATTAVERDIMLGIDEAGVILTDEQKDFLFADASRMEEIEEAQPSYDSAFISEVQSLSDTRNEEQLYPTHTKIINSTIGDDQIDSDIIFDSPNRNVNSGSIEKDTHVPDLYIIRDLEKQRDKLDFDVKDYKRKNEELQKTHSILKRQMSENEDKYHDTVLDLEAKLKKNVDLNFETWQFLNQGMLCLGNKPLINFYVSEKTYAYGAIRAENQNLLFTISELKTRLENVKKGMNAASSVRRPMLGDSPVRLSVLLL
ncbi:hypothetical protein Tco_0643892 [Tanacetum coccineum]